MASQNRPSSPEVDEDAAKLNGSETSRELTGCTMPSAFEKESTPAHRRKDLESLSVGLGASPSLKEIRRL